MKKVFISLPMKGRTKDEIERTIENIKEKCDKMTAAPIYLGLCEITKKGVQMLLFIAPCKEDYRYDVERALFKNLKIMFEESGIKLGNAGVVVEDEE